MQRFGSVANLVARRRRQAGKVAGWFSACTFLAGKLLRVRNIALDGGVALVLRHVLTQSIDTLLIPLSGGDSMRRFALSLAVAAVALASSSWCLADDQQIAQAIVEKLREHQKQGQLKGFDIDLNVEDGKVTMTGNVSNADQHQIAIDAARFIPGVKVVINDLKISGEVAEHPAQQQTLPSGLLQPGTKPTIQQAVTPTTTLSQPLSTIPQAATSEPIADAQPPAGGAQQEQPLQRAVSQPIAASNKPDTAEASEEPRSQFTSAGTRSVLKLGQMVETAEEALPVIATDPTAGSVSQADLVEEQPLGEQHLAQAPAAQQPLANQPIPYGYGPAPAWAMQQQLAQQHFAQQQQFAQQQFFAQQQQLAQQQSRVYMPAVAHASSTLPGSPAAQGRQQMPIHLVQAQQMMQAQQMAPAPAFVQGTGGGVIPARYDHPHMPGYAWPGYASYPNYAAVQYPKQYSAHAWPYIGPFYPYPQVPLGWRKVTLSWDDGWWFLDFKDRGYGPYITR
jgi:hypothetical protein